LEKNGACYRRSFVFSECDETEARFNNVSADAVEKASRLRRKAVLAAGEAMEPVIITNGFRGVIEGDFQVRLFRFANRAPGAGIDFSKESGRFVLKVQRMGVK
jgi:hypothetical protein